MLRKKKTPYEQTIREGRDGRGVGVGGGQRSPCPGGDIEAEMGGGDDASVIKKGAGKSIPGYRAGLSEGVRRKDWDRGHAGLGANFTIRAPGTLEKTLNLPEALCHPLQISQNVYLARYS